MKFKIDGSYVNGTDMGHPDGVDIFTACCCGFVAGDTSEKRDANARLVIAAPEMYELLAEFRDTATIETPTDVLERVNTLLTKIEGGGE